MEREFPYARTVLSDLVLAYCRIFLGLVKINESGGIIAQNQPIRAGQCLYLQPIGGQLNFNDGRSHWLGPPLSPPSL
jgi:hypothetical protein